MFWGCIGFGRLGHLVEVPVAMNQDDYVNILTQYLLVSAQYIFQLTQSRNQISTSTIWSDPRPILNRYQYHRKHMWMVNEKKIKIDPAEIPQQPKQHAKQHWNEITLYTLRSLYHRMPKRIRLLRPLCGHPTKY